MLYTTEDIADVLELDKSTITRYAREGKIKGYKVDKPVSEGGPHYVFSPEEASKLMDRKLTEYKRKHKKLNSKIKSIRQHLNK